MQTSDISLQNKFLQIYTAASMGNTLLKILNEVRDQTKTPETAQKEIAELFGTQETVPEQPKLVGHLNKIFGYNGFEKIDIGTEVYEYQDRYYFEMKPLNGSKSVIQKFYKDTLAPCINFIK